MTDAELLADIDKAFIASMQAIDAEGDASVKEQAAKVATMRDEFVAKVAELTKSPLKLEDDGHPAP